MSTTADPARIGLARLAGRGALVGASLAVGVPFGLEFLVVGAPHLGVLWPFAAVVGAALGALLLPLVARGLLGHVPLRRVVLEMSLGTALGAGVGLLGLFGPGGALVIAPWTALAGCLLAVGQLRLRRPRRPRRASDRAAPDAA